MALRPRASPFRMSSRYGSLTLAAVGGFVGGVGVSAGESASESVVTPLAGFAAGGSVVTSLAGFAGGLLPHPRGGRTATPAAFKYSPAVSRRTPVCF
jgi:hypothetical protein